MPRSIHRPTSTTQPASLARAARATIDQLERRTLLATLISSNLANGTSVVAQYKLAAPDGHWSASADGTYTVSVVPDQVTDTSGNFASSQVLGSFRVNIAALSPTQPANPIGLTGNPGGSSN